jgi:hypothetical protein
MGGAWPRANAGSICGKQAATELNTKAANERGNKRFEERRFRSQSCEQFITVRLPFATNSGHHEPGNITGALQIVIFSRSAANRTGDKSKTQS